MPSSPAVLHVNDCAGTTVRLLEEAARRHLPWSYQPLLDRAYPGSPASGPARAALAAAWLARLGLRARRADLLHVHYASVVRHTRWTGRPYVLHLHGTDIRDQQYDPRWTARIHRAVREARAVLYSTPDLAEHALPLRPDARYLPVPISTAGLPRWAPASRPRVVFASRWHPVKGLATQLEVARELGSRCGDAVELVGLDWGPGAQAARGCGVRLVPRAGHGEFLRLLASAHVVVGQSGGILATSELEAVAIGVPVAARVEPRWHRGEPPAVLGGPMPVEGSVEPLVAAVIAALDDPAAAAERLAGPSWVRRTHGTAAAVDELTDLYELMA